MSQHRSTRSWLRQLRLRGWLRLSAVGAVLVCACSSSGGGPAAKVDPEPQTPVAPTASTPSTPAYRLYEAVVINTSAASDPYDVGDTITVDLRLDRRGSVTVSVISEGNVVGSIPMILTGPREAGRVVVRTEALNVRSCASTRCDRIGSLSEGDLTEVDSYTNKLCLAGSGSEPGRCCRQRPRRRRCTWRRTH